MYYIRKYRYCWAIHNDQTGKSRKLSEVEKQKVAQAYPEFCKPDVCTLFQDDFPQICNKP
jgi:hypothetical protein